MQARAVAFCHNIQTQTESVLVRDARSTAGLKNLPVVHPATAPLAGLVITAVHREPAAGASGNSLGACLQA